MATINFLYRSTKEIAPLNLRLLYTHNGENYVYGGKIKLELEKNYWKIHTKNSRNLDIINKQHKVDKELNKIRDHILLAFKDDFFNNIDAKWLKKQIDRYYNPTGDVSQSIPKNLINYIDYYIRDRQDYGDDVSDTSIQRYGVVQNKLRLFQEHRGETILIKNINNDLKKEWIRYLKGENYSMSTIKRDFIYVKAFCDHAKTKGVETSLELVNFKVKIPKSELQKKQNEKLYLNFDELTEIENTNDLAPHLSNVRDWLIISCYTGQRISDFMRFNKEMVHYEKNKKGELKPVIEFTQKKTGKAMAIALSSKISKILKNRNGNFPRPISEQKYNDYLKELCKSAKINGKVNGSKLQEIEPDSGKYRKIDGVFDKWELMVSTVGRRSFASNYYGKMPTSYLIYVTGHSTENMLRVYLGKGNKDFTKEVMDYID